MTVSMTQIKRGFFGLDNYEGMTMWTSSTAHPAGEARGGVSATHAGTSPLSRQRDKSKLPPHRTVGDWAYNMLTEDGEPLLSMQEQQLIDEIYGDTLGHTADEYRDLRTGTSHYQNKSYAESYQLGVHESVQDHLLWLLDGDHDPSADREIILSLCVVCYS